jgi:multiphosphoryl transfer protein
MTGTVAEVLRPTAIAVGQVAADKAEAIARVGQLLVDGGYVSPAYITAMQERETIISTYLGNGISLPHGTSEAQDTILSTGLAVAQFPAGVAWGEEPARLVIGVAAKSEEHIGILSRLAGVLEDEDLCTRLGTTSDPMEIHAALTAEPSDTPVSPPPAPAGERGRTLRIANPSGLHARPAAEITEAVMDLDAEVRIATGERQASAFSITQLIALGASVGDEVTVNASGPDADAALDAVLGVLLREGDNHP